MHHPHAERVPGDTGDPTSVQAAIIETPPDPDEREDAVSPILDANKRKAEEGPSAPAKEIKRTEETGPSAVKEGSPPSKKGEDSPGESNQEPEIPDGGGFEFPDF